MLGVLLSYILNFTNFNVIILKRKWILICISVLLIVPGFYWNAGSFFMNTVELTLVNIRFSILVLLALNIDGYFKNRRLSHFKILIKPVGFIGWNSYSIYLWHLNSKSIIYFIFTYNTKFMTLLYITLSIAIGIIMSYLIEKPSLQMRDYLFNKIDTFKTKYKFPVEKVNI